MDFGPDRLTLLKDLGATLARDLHPKRILDLLKPHEIQNDKGRRISLTHATVDHIVPEAGFGWTGVDNLVVACQFCNQGRAIYRRDNEAISTVIASSAMACPSWKPHSMPRQIGIVAALLSKRRCDRCEASADRAELTILLGEERTDLRWLTPWNAQVLCYDCLPD
ncbi:MAG: HNH endonuclease [Deltaproteobacteria bacterium]|nr:HNH endonuclease [Deltaproteobacteria bacterium]